MFFVALQCITEKSPCTKLYLVAVSVNGKDRVGAVLKNTSAYWCALHKHCTSDYQLLYFILICNILIQLVSIHSSDLCNQVWNVMPWSHLCVKPPRMSNVRQIYEIKMFGTILSRSATYYAALTRVSLLSPRRRHNSK